MVQRAREHIIRSKGQQRGERGSNGVQMERKSRRIIYHKVLIKKNKPVLPGLKTRAIGT